jgi:ParB-like chromosome segregation protein Spo0J
MTFNDSTVGIAVTEPSAAGRFSPVDPEIPLQVNGEIARQYRGDELGEDPILSAAADRDVYTVPLDQLLAADSPRLAGEDESHTLRLAEVANQLPPILVHRPTMRVIDGMHRLRATMASGKQEIQVRFFDGDEDEAFLHAVRENVTHGLPLTLDDRRSAAQRIIIRSPHLSDRSIGRYTGLSDKTISALRERSSAECVQTSTRVGMDGRARPLSSFEGRQRAVELWTARPDASLREVAAVAGVSVGTAHDVRKRMQRGEDPVLSRQPGVKPGGRSAAALSGQVVAARRRAREVADFDPRPLLESLVHDPALRQSESGRGLLRWLHGHVVRGTDVSQFVEAVPPHRTECVAALAEHCAGVWHRIADCLAAERKAGDQSGAALPPAVQPHRESAWSGACGYVSARPRNSTSQSSFAEIRLLRSANYWHFASSMQYAMDDIKLVSTPRAMLFR